jgi:glycosyltransferase involved in cell wall biosynthesis
MLSVLIPSRNELFLQKTVDDIFDNAAGDVECIVSLDGYWPDPPLKEHPKLHVIHRSKPAGMRAGINACATVARGKFIMKCDAHCAFAEGFDEVLQADCDDNWVVIPRRYSLNPDTWAPQESSPGVWRMPIDYEFLSYPYWKEDHYGIHGTRWGERTKQRLNDPEYEIDDNMGFQGSCWFTTREHFLERIGGLQEEGYGTFIGEPQEVGNKTWLGGGRLVTNKKTWYSHLHKGKRFGRGYSVSRRGLRDGNVYSVQYWMTNAWPGRIHDIEWLVEKFWPVPSWPDDRSLWRLKDEDLPEWAVADKMSKVEISDANSYILKKYKPEIPRRMPINLPIGRDDLPGLFAELGYKVGAEIGIERGLYSEKLCQAGLRLYAIDAWTAYSGYREHVSQSKLDRFYNETRDRLAGYDHQLIRCFSMDALKLIPDGSLDFVYIDGNHEFRHATDDTDGWGKKVRVGGIIAGHDFRRNKRKAYRCHVKDVVHAWTYSHEISPWFITGGDRRSKSWFWVKTADE